jgi:hypothetical protein
MNIENDLYTRTGHPYQRHRDTFHFDQKRDHGPVNKDKYDSFMNYLKLLHNDLQV